MRIVAKPARGFKVWVTSRPKLDIEESVTWFLFSLVYALSLSSDELGLKFSGIIPQLSAPLLSLAMVFLSLVVSVLILIEPLLPSELHRWTKAARTSYPGQYLRQFSMWLAFILGWLAGFNMISDVVPELSWLTAVIGYMGIGIFLVLLVKIALAPWFELKSHQKKQS